MIAKGELRIGRYDLYKDKFFTSFFHVKCAFSLFKRARVSTNIISCTSQVDGMDMLTPGDREIIGELIAAGNNERTAPLKAEYKRKEKQDTTGSMGTRKCQLKPSAIPSINVMYTNADQLTHSKKDELITKIEQQKPLVIAICEVKPKNSSDRQLLDYVIPGYTMHPVNLDESFGRGVAVYTHESLDKSVIQVKLDLKFEEACIVEIRLRGGDMMCFGCIYRSPTTHDKSDENNENLNNLLRCISKKKYSHVCLVGDFNFRDINWENYTTVHGEKSKEVKFIETVRDCFLHQHITKPTRRRGNDNPSVIDLILTDEAMQVSDIAHLSPLGKSDHTVMIFKFHCYLDYTKDKETFSYGRANFPGMRDQLAESSWMESFLETHSAEKKFSVEDIWASFKSKIDDLRDKFVPKSKSKGKPSWKSRGNIPIDETLQEEIRRKQIFHRNWMNKKTDADGELARLRYTQSRNRVKRLMRQARKRYEKSICHKSKENPKVFWSHVRQMLKTKSGVAPLLADVKDKDSTKFGDKEKADILQGQFSSVFTREPDGDIPRLENRTAISIKSLKITVDMVKRELKKLNVNKSCGPDGIHPRMLKELSDFIAAPLVILLNITLAHHKIPEDWRKAFVSPIFKKGARNRAENYRPISLTSIVCKIMESVVKETILGHMISNNLLSKKQYGFISGRSTVTQLLSYLDKCAATMAQGGVTDAIYLDFAKAFDTVPHSRLIGKLQAYGITGDLLKWVEAFLRDRSQVVRVNGEESFSAPVLSGIPQGSVLGPLLFVIYINDLPDRIKSDTLMFADDTKIMRCIMSEVDSLGLQQDIHELEQWSDRWLLGYNTKKCHVLTIGKIENIKHTHNYELFGNQLEHVFEEVDLGVTIDYELRFEEHISKKVSKANAISGLIRRSFAYLDCDLFNRLYKTFVRPHLEYAQAVWSPVSQKLIDMLENVQIRATKMVDGLSNLVYEDRLRRLDLPTLVYRRARGDMIQVYKHFHTYDQDLLPNIFRRQIYGTRNHDYKLVWRKPKDGIRGPQANSFYYRIMQTWNDLPANVVKAQSINEFKNLLDDAWNDSPAKYNPKPMMSGS